MSTYEIAISGSKPAGSPEYIATLVDGSEQTTRKYPNWGDLTRGMSDLGIDNDAIRILIGELATKDRTFLQLIELPDDGVKRFKDHKE